MITLPSSLPLRLWGNLKDTRAFGLSLIMLCLSCMCWTQTDVLILLPAYFSSSGLSSRCSSKCFLLRPFTTRLQNRSRAPASALQLFNESIIHDSLSTSVKMAPFPPEHRFNFSRSVYPFILFTLTFLWFPSAFLWSLITVLQFLTSLLLLTQQKINRWVLSYLFFVSKCLGESLPPSILWLHW